MTIINAADVMEYESMMFIYFVPARDLLFDSDCSWWCAELTILPQHLETLLSPTSFN